MRSCLLLLRPLALPATAAVRPISPVPSSTRGLPALVQRFKEANRNRKTLARQPVASATWDCPVDSADLPAASGIYLEGLDAISRQNAVRQAHPPLRSGNRVIVPLEGSLLGRRAGEATARKLAQQAAGGEAYMRETSDISFNSIDDMSGGRAGEEPRPLAGLRWGDEGGHPGLP